MEPPQQRGAPWPARARAWSELGDLLTLPLWEAMLDAAAVGLRTCLLDVGCGAGGASVLAARRGAQVNGLDPAAARVARARGRVRDGDFRVGALDALPYATSTFEAIIAANMLERTAQPRAVVGELRRVCRSGGRVVVSAWGQPDECAQHAIAAAVERSLATALPGGPQGGPWGTLATPGSLERLMTAAGLVVLGSATVVCPCEYADRETAWQAHAATIPLRPARSRVGVAPLKQAVLTALAPYTTGAGSVRLANTFRYVIATPPADDCLMDCSMGGGHEEGAGALLRAAAETE